jgi:hypothetical protein
MYFPKSQIKSNLYTNGGEYILSTTKENYKGYYYETSGRTKYTGKTPQDGPNILLSSAQILNDIPNISSPDIPNNIELNNSLDYLTQTSGKLYPFINVFSYPKNQNFNSRTIPLSNPTQPTQQDQNLGAFQRYFCKKNNELKYLEIDKSTHDKLKSHQQDIAWDLYTPISTLWYIKGNKEQTFKANKGLVTLIEEKQKWYGFTQWFKDRFLQYYLES